MSFNPNKNPFYVLAFTVVVSGLFTGVIVALSVATEPAVRANQRALTERALVEMFALADPSKMTAAQVGELVRNRIAGWPDAKRPNDPAAQPIYLTDPNTGDKTQILIAYTHDLPAGFQPEVLDQTGVLGYAFPIEGVGFWAMIKGWMAVDPSLDKSLGIVFLNHQETPGLGGRITEDDFRDQFVGLNISPPSDDKQVVYIDRNTVTQDSPEYSRHVNAITGASATSTAVNVFLNANLKRFHEIAAAAGLAKPPGANE